MLAVVDTNDAPPDSLLQIHLTALANAANTANGAGSRIRARSSTQSVVVHILADPTNTALPPLKDVNGSSQAVVVARHSVHLHNRLSQHGRRDGPQPGGQRRSARWR